MNKTRLVPYWLQQIREKRRNRRGESMLHEVMTNDVLQPPYITTRDRNDVESHWTVTKDVAFNRHSMNDGHHVSPYNNGEVKVGADGIDVVLVQAINEEAFRSTLSMATRATIGVDITAGTKDTADWEEMLKGGLQTALETQVIVFAVSGVSRTCTHQLVRTRKAAFHQQSQRASFMGDQPETRMPESIWRNPYARAAYMKAIEASHEAYRIACEQDISYQDARFSLLEGTNNFILLEFPVREFLNVYAYRGCSMFQWEIVAVMRQCRDRLIEAHPWLEPYVKISCEKTGPVMMGEPYAPDVQIAEHHCTFQGWENVEGQCDFPWALEAARTFKPEHHKIERKS